MNSILNTFKTCFKDDKITKDKDILLSADTIPLKELNKSPTGFTGFSTNSDSQGFKSKITLNQGEKLYSFKLSEDIFSTLYLQKQSEFSHLNSINSENQYALSSNKNVLNYNNNNDNDNDDDQLNSKEDDNEEKVFSMKNTVIQDNVVSQNKKLQLEDHEGEFLNGEILAIDAAGLNIGKRAKRDGYTFFGPCEKAKDCIINDYVINYSTSLCPTRLFVIFFDLKVKSYFIRPLNDEGNYKENHLLMKINDSYPINQKAYFSLNSIALYVEIPHNTNSNTISITVMYEEGKKDFTFDKTHPEITIGRKKNCDVPISLGSISKIHCSLIYDNEQNIWRMNNGYKGKKSTNGLWYLIRNKTLITEEITYIKINSDVIKMTMFDNNSKLTY